MDRPAARGFRRRRRNQWWKAFASPKLMVFAIPALIFPLGTAVVLNSRDAALTPVEQAIGALPQAAGMAGARPGAPDAGGEAGGDVSPLGSGAARLTSAVAMPLLAASAGSLATQSAMRNSERSARGTDRDYALTEFSLLHPDERARDNLVIGDLALVYSNPADAGLTAKIFQAFCTAQPGDPYYTLGIAALPISQTLKQMVIKWETTPGTSGRCPQVTG